MIFDAPLPFSDAVKILRAKGLLPTDLSSAGLRQIDAYLRSQSIFSARTTKLGYLEEMRGILQDVLEGKINGATARARLQEALDRLSYTPATGFGDGEAPPAEPGSLRDLSSNKRLQLIIDTQTRHASNTALRTAGQTDFALYAWPCYELIRTQLRRVPRGKKEIKSGLIDNPGQDWPSRWQKAGGKFYADGRMIARKDDVIWSVLGDSTEFADALDTEVPPFAFNSGYGWQEIRRDEAVNLGVIDRETDIQGTTVQRADRQKQADRFTAPELQNAIAILRQQNKEEEANLSPLFRSILEKRGEISPLPR